MPIRDIAELSQDHDEQQFSWLMWIIPLLLAASLYIVSRYNFLLFHTLAEFISINIALIMSVVAWQMYFFTRNNYLMYLGSGYFWIGILDSMHTLSYQGMHIYEMSSANFSTQYWIATRLVEAALLLSGPWFLTHRLRRLPAFLFFGVITALIIVSVSQGVFPETYIEGTGLTAFKIGSEYVIIGMLILALVYLRRQSDFLEKSILNIVSASIILTMFAELAFTFYVTVYDASNVIGHIFKLFSYWLIFMATVYGTLQKPFQAMARGASTYDAIPNPTIVTDDSGIVRQANEAACILTGKSKIELLGGSSHELFHPYFMDKKDCPICISRGHAKRLDACEVQFPNNGGWREYTVSPLPGGVVEVVRDITEKRHVQAQYQELNKLKNIIVETLPAMLFVKRADNGQYVEWNSAAEKLTGLSKEEVLGKTDIDLFPEEAAAFTGMDKQVLSQGICLDIPEENIKTRINGTRLLHTQKTPIYDDTGQPVYLLGISLDITEQKNTEKMLQHSQKMEAIGQLAGGIAHDFNNQLGLVIGYLDFLKDFVASDPEPSEWAKISLQAAKRCVDLTQQLLMISRHNATTKEIIDINERITEIAIMLERSVTPAVKVQYDFSKDVLLALLNPGELQDSLLNLAINARDAMPKGGTYTVQTRQVSITEEDLSAFSELEAGDYIRITLTDTGTGIAPELQEHIFEPFFTTKPLGKGSGLGLAMVYAFVHRYGGDILVDSEPGRGTSFHLYLPLVHEEFLDVPQNEEQRVTEYHGNETILVVDDEAGLLRMATQILTSAGYSVITASDAMQALDLLQGERNIDLLFSDIVMPGGINGYDLAEQAVQIRPEISVLLTSGYTIEKLAKDTSHYWVGAILRKPYHKNDLLQSIRELLDTKNIAVQRL